MTDNMAKERLAGTDLEVSNVAFGTYKLGTKLEAAAAVDLMGRAFYHHGINFIDTSDNYPAAEGLIGRALRDKVLIRDDIVIASKTGLATSQAEANKFYAMGRDADTSPLRVEKQIEKSLRIMGIEEIDLYQLHTYDPKVAPADIAYTMTKLIDEGKIRYWGVCNYTKEQLDELLETCRVTGAIEPVTYQQYHNMADRQFESDIKDAKAKGLATLAFSPLMRGVITSEYATGLYGQQRALYERSMMTNVLMPEADRKAYVQACKLLEVHNIAKDQGYSLQQLAIAWSLGNPDIDVTLLGAYNKKHLDELMRVSSGELNNDLQEKADALAGKLIIK